MKYFENEYRSYEREKTKNNSEPKKNEDDVDFPNKSRNKIFAAIFAATAMLGYATVSGILEVIKYFQITQLKIKTYNFCKKLRK